MMSEDVDNTIDDDNWFDAIRLINKEVKRFRKTLADNEIESRNATYINEWNQLYIDIGEMRDSADYAPMWRETVQLIFAEPKNLYGYIAE